VFKNAEAVMLAAGSDKSHVLKTTVSFLSYFLKPDPFFLSQRLQSLCTPANALSLTLTISIVILFCSQFRLDTGLPQVNGRLCTLQQAIRSFLRSIQARSILCRGRKAS
jgi:hypothetical protein